MRKMTATRLEEHIREGLEKHSLVLGHEGYYSAGTVCAIGGALAYAAATRSQLEDYIHSAVSPGGHSTARVSAKILNHGLKPRDMVMLEAGYEGYRRSDYVGDEMASRGEAFVNVNVRNPYYRLGRKLREESFKPQKSA